LLGAIQLVWVLLTAWDDHLVELKKPVQRPIPERYANKKKAMNADRLQAVINALLIDLPSVDMGRFMRVA